MQLTRTSSAGRMSGADDDQLGESQMLKHKYEGRTCYTPARYVFAGIVMMAAFLNVVLRGSLSVVITAMVKRNSSTVATHNSSDSCPAEAVADLNSTAGVVVTGDFDWDEVTQSTVLGANSYGMVATCLLGARIAEMWSSKYMFAISNTVSGAFFLLLPVTARWSVNALIVFQVISGMFMGPVQPIHMAISAAWFPPQERQQLGGFTLSAVSLGFTVSNALTGYLVDSFGWEFVFYLFASLVMAWTVVWMIFVFDSPNDHPRISEEERAYISGSTKKDKVQTKLRLPWKEILLSPPVWAHIAMGLPMTWLTICLINALPTYMRNILHFSTTEAGLISAIPQMVSWLSTMAFGFLSQWIRRKKYISHLITYHIFNGLSTLGAAAVLLCVPLVSCNSVATVLLLSMAVTLSAAYVGGSQLNQMDLAVNYSGTLHGVSMTIFSIVGFLAPTITGVLTNNQQTLTAWSRVFYVAAGVNIVPFFIYLFFGSVDEQPWNRAQQDEIDASTRKASAVDGEAQSQKQSSQSASPYT